MKQDRTTEWLEGADWDLFERQYKEPYRITNAFFKWLESLALLKANGGSNIADIGAGMGANSYHLTNQYPGNSCTGIDLNPECVHRGNQRLSQLGATGCVMEQGDLYQLPDCYQNKFDGLFSLATLSWLPEFNQAAECLIRLNPGWIGITSLFYDGPVDAIIKTIDYSKPIQSQPSTDKYYNIYSLPRVKAFFEQHGYAEFHHTPFDIDIDLPKPAHGGMATYTEKLADGRRLQISGPVQMSWHFIVAKRTP